jgi:hypothetical protein
MVIDISTVRRIAVATWTRVDADINTLLGTETIKDLVVDIHEFLEELSTSPRVLRVISRSQSPFGEVDTDALGPCLEALADIFLALVHEVIDELVLWVPLDLALQGIQEIQHTWCNNSSLHFTFRCIRPASLEIVRGPISILERTGGETRKLPMMSIGKYCKILAIGLEVVCQTSTAAGINLC